MTHIVLTDEQAKTFAAAPKPVLVRDGQGNVLGTLSPIWMEEDVAEAKKNLTSPGSWRTTEQVLARLHSLERK